MAEIKTCINCNRIIPIDKIVCEKCYAMYINRLREYLMVHQGVSMELIHKETRIPMEVLEDIYKDKKAEEMEAELNRVLADSSEEKKEQDTAEDKRLAKLRILKELQQELQTPAPPPEKKESIFAGATMHFLDDRRKGR